MTKFTIALSPGHTPRSPGASRGNITEYGLSAAIIGDLVFRLDKAGHTAHLIGSGSNAAQIARINALHPDFGLELHFNNMSTYPAWHGTECLHSGSISGLSLARDINNSLCSKLKTKNRGVHVGHYQLDKRKKIIDMIRLTNCPFVVVEPLFLSNDSDFQKIDIQLISIAIFEGVINYWESAS